MVKNSQPLDSSGSDWYEKGQRLARHGSHREAVEALDLAIEEDPLNADAYFVRGASQYALGNYREAGDDLDAAAILGCRDAQFWSKHAIHPATGDADDGPE